MQTGLSIRAFMELVFLEFFQVLNLDTAKRGALHMNFTASRIVFGHQYGHRYCQLFT